MNTSSRPRVAILGATGYSGEELVRILLQHPSVDLVLVTSRPNAGQSIAQVYPRFAHLAKARSLRFVEPDAAKVAREAEVVFLALPHGVAAEYALPLLEGGCRVIDLSADFRLRDANVYQEFYGHEHPAPEWLSKAVYGLPEVYRDRIRNASLIASPGCYPTSILLPLLPLVRDRLIHPASIIANSMSGVTGAGRKAELDYLFCECNESARAYGVPKHRHLSEIEQELSIAAGEGVTIQFIPHLIPVNRGILTTLYAAPAADLRDAAARDGFGSAVAESWRKAYGAEPFVQILEGKNLPDTKHVVGGNQIQMAWRLDPRTGRLLMFSAEDNIVKGAGGQAVQSMNILCGLEETLGLI